MTVEASPTLPVYMPATPGYRKATAVFDTFAPMQTRRGRYRGLMAGDDPASHNQAMTSARRSHIPVVPGSERPVLPGHFRILGR